MIRFAKSRQTLQVGAEKRTRRSLNTHRFALLLSDPKSVIEGDDTGSNSDDAEGNGNNTGSNGGDTGSNSWIQEAT